MLITISDPIVSSTISQAQADAQPKRTKNVMAGQQTRSVRWSSPDWRDTWIYFLLIDGFNNPAASPKGLWSWSCPVYLMLDSIDSADNNGYYPITTYYLTGAQC